MSILQAIFLGLVEGLTEFVPVSSSGHLIIARSIFHITGNNDLAVDAIFQLATILAVLVYFWSDLSRLFKSFVRLCLGRSVESDDRKMIFAIILGTIPAVIVGLLLEQQIETVFRNVDLVAWALLAGSALMFAAEKWGGGDKAITAFKGFSIGLFQTLALVPGVSRSGATISGGLLEGVNRSDAIRFSFLLSFPVIVGSGLKKLFDVYKTGALATLALPLSIGFVVSFVVGLASIHFLISYLKNHKLTVFIWYRVILAITILIFL